MVSYLYLVYRTHVRICCLNPYCSGRWSRTAKSILLLLMEFVLILIVVEDGLVQEWTDLQTDGEVS